MARPKTDHPTPAELEVLKILWETGSCTVRDVLDVFRSQRKRRAYTSVMSLMNVMAEKSLLSRKRDGRAFVYSAKAAREQTLGGMLGDLWHRAYEGSASTLVAHLLEEASPTADELDQIRAAIEAYRDLSARETR